MFSLRSTDEIDYTTYKMGRKKDDVESLVDDKNEDQGEVSKDSSSRRRRRDRPKKSKDGAKKDLDDKVQSESRSTKEVKKVTGDEEDLDATIQKKRARDKRRTREKVNSKDKVADDDENNIDTKEVDGKAQGSSLSRRQKTSKSARKLNTEKSGKARESTLNLNDDQEEKNSSYSSDNIKSQNSPAKTSKKLSKKKKNIRKDILSEDEEAEIPKASNNPRSSRNNRKEQAADIDSEEDTRPRKSKKSKEKSPRTKSTNKKIEKDPNTSSSGKRSRSTKTKESGSKEGSKQSLRGVDNPVYELDEKDEYMLDPNAYRSDLYGLDDDILDSPYEEGGDVDSEEEGKAYRLPPAVSPIDLSPSSPYLLQPHFVSTARNPNGLSEPVSQIYREKVPGRFSKTTQKKISSISKFSNNQVEPQFTKPTMTPLDLGLECQKVFRAVGVFSHGFLAGMAFWQLLMVYILSQEGLLHEMFPGDCVEPKEYCDQLKFVELYSPLSQPLHLVFYLLTTICTISIMDRYDVAQFDFRQLQMMLTFRSGGIAVVIYIATLLITLVSTRYDDKLSLHM